MKRRAALFAWNKARKACSRAGKTPGSTAINCPQAMRQGVRCVSGTLQSKRHGAFQREARPCRSIRGLESRTRRLALMAKRRGQHCRRLQRESAAASRSCAGAFTRSSAGRSAAEAFRIRPCIRWRTAHRRRHRQLCAGRPPLRAMTACASPAPSAALCWSSAPVYDGGIKQYLGKGDAEIRPPLRTMAA